MKNQGRLCSVFISALVVSLFPVVLQANLQGKFVAGEYVVKLKEQVGSMSMGTLQVIPLGFNTRVKKILSHRTQTVLVERPLLETAESVVAELSANPNVVRVEPNYIYHASARPNDSKLDRLWGLINQNKSAGEVDINVEQAWEITKGSKDVVVAVIDTGVNYNHPDLKNNMWVNTAEKNGRPGVDDDGNGYVDDIYGYDFANKDGDPMDDNDHGTHCAGTIGAEGNNGIGVVGVNWDVKIMALKFLGGKGAGALDAAIQAIDYATSQGVDVMSNSWGGGGKSRLLEEAIERAESAGILFVAAAGNSRNNNDIKASYPASYDTPNVISVAAIDRKGKLASFSNYGKTSVHVAAPGVRIFSTGKRGYKSLDGTSMATPHVSGIAALLRAQNKNISYQEIKSRILETSVHKPHLRSRMAYGIVNAYNALMNEVPPPEANDPAAWASVSKSVSSAHPYADNSDQSFRVTVPGAKRVSVYFHRFETEKDFDKVIFYDGAGNKVGTMTGRQGRSFSPIAEGDTIVIRLVSDQSITRHGFDITKVAYVPGGNSSWKSVVDRVSTSHPYENSIDQEVVFESPGASEVRVQFGQFETEKNYDFVYFYDEKGQELGRWDGSHSGEMSPVAQGEKIILRIKTDYSIAKYGFDVESVVYR